MSGLSKPVLALLVAGWLADLLAGKDRDVEAGVSAYESGELETALSHFDAAVDRLGDRPELSFDRGLSLLAQGETEAARKAFEHASESEDSEVRASALYELGNIALDGEDFDTAITAYIECLKARPEHQNAKWNLELALLKRTEKEKEEEEEDEDQGESGGEDDGDSGGEESGGESGGESGSESGGESGSEEPQGESGSDTGDEEPQGESGEQEQGSGGEQEPPADTGGEPEPEPEPEPEQGSGGQQQPPPSDNAPPPQPLNQMDIEKALEDLDEQDVFLMDRPTGRQRQPVQDW